MLIQTNFSEINFYLLFGLRQFDEVKFKRLYIGTTYIVIIGQYLVGSISSHLEILKNKVSSF